MRLRLITALALAPIVSAASLAPIREASACGGCFPSQTETTVVNGHRMALSVSPVQTVLWDQIQYAGDPTEFAWVLPVKAGAVIQIASDAWFETLDAATSVRITNPFVSCGGGGLGCGASADALGAEAGDGSGVTVLHRGTVGPYDTVTLATDVPGALNDWLTQHGFAIDASTQPVIDAYVAEGFDFIALRLQPGKEVQEMKPVRVVTPGASPTLPLRMVAAGTGPQVAITLFTISEARLATRDFPGVAVPLDLISWDFTVQESNYGTLRQQTLAAAGGRAWLTPYAQRGSLLSPVFSPNALGGVTYTSTGSLTPVDTIAAAYVQQGLANGEASDSACAMNFPELAGSTEVVASPCPPGVPLSDPSCGEVAPDRIDARLFACGGLDDLAVAMIGLHPRDVWLTRLEADLPREALDTDLVLIPAARQEPVDNWLRARVSVNADDACPSGGPPVLLDEPPSRWTGRLAGLGLAGLALAALAARRRLRAPVRGLGRRAPPGDPEPQMSNLG
ncbi:MAG: DUF2330 domain-containing protein [Polyangiaceae bacterium]|nr:DUF2330 domain-containing protein [Polyangiaceae bacterium]